MNASWVKTVFLTNSSFKWIYYCLNRLPRFSIILSVWCFFWYIETFSPRKQLVLVALLLQVSSWLINLPPLVNHNQGLPLPLGHFHMPPGSDSCKYLKLFPYSLNCRPFFHLTEKLLTNGDSSWVALGMVELRRNHLMRTTICEKAGKAFWK